MSILPMIGGIGPEQVQWWVEVIGLTSIALWIFPLTRPLISGIYGRLLIPMIFSTAKYGGSWSFWIVKKILLAHKVLITNLMSPRTSIFPGLEDDEEG